MFIRVQDITMHVLIEGAHSAPALVLLHSLGTNAHVWDAQAAALSRSFRVIRPDLRGHGLTSCTKGPYKIGMLAADVAALLAALDVGRAHICGISLGGLIAQQFAYAYPAQTASLVLVDTAMAIPPPQSWIERAAIVRAEGIGAIADAVLARWVTRDFSGHAEAAGLRAMLICTPAEGYAAAAEAIATADLTHSAARIDAPTLIIVGDQDQATPPALAQAMHQAIAGSALRIVEHAAHIPLVEKPAEITAAILAFLAPAPAADEDAGMQVRREVLGDAHVDRAMRNTTDFDRDFQAFITRTAWGGVWARPGLDRRMRSMLTIAMLASLGHEEELKLHLRATQNTGATPADIAELLLQLGIYAGVPAANTGFRIAKEIFKEIYP